MKRVSMAYIGLVAALEQAVNAVLALDPETRAGFRRIEGRVIAIDLSGLATTLYLQPEGDRLRVMGYYDGPVDTTLRGTPPALLRMSRGDAAGGLFGGEVKIEGDVELGQRFKALLDRLDIDWEEHLSRLTGDVVAHRIGSFVRGLGAWGRDAGDSVGRDTGEFLQEEVELLPNRGETEAFLAEVDRLRHDVDRLEARIGLLRRALRGGD